MDRHSLPAEIKNVKILSLLFVNIFTIRKQNSEKYEKCLIGNQCDNALRIVFPIGADLMHDFFQIDFAGRDVFE